MPALSTTDEFLDLVRKSGVVEDAQLDAAIDRLRTEDNCPGEPKALAAWLLRDGLLTSFQARQMLKGKWQGFRIGKYRILELLGAGGMGRVFLCEHELMKKLVAVKVLPISQTQTAGVVERFHREARAAGALDHPNIVRAHDVDCVDRLHYLVMEFVDGANLHEIVAKNGPLAIGRAAEVARQAALGLQNAHEAGWIHRDIKPGNILVDRGGTVKILDMGLARLFHDKKDSLTKDFDGQSILGTADYLAPEQALSSHDVDIRADIYSLGATFYYLLTGRAPFEEGTVAQKLLWHQQREPQALASLRPELPPDLIAVAARMMAKDRTQRYQTPAEVAAALGPWSADPEPPSESDLPRWCPAVRKLLQSDSGSRRTYRAVANPATTVASADATLAIPGADVVKAGEDRLPPIAFPVEVTNPEPGEPSAPVPSGRAKTAHRPRTWRVILMLSAFAAAGVAALVLLAPIKEPRPPSQPPITKVQGQALPPGAAAVPDDKPLTVAEAAKRVGDKVTVEMEVKSAGVAKSKATIFLNSEADYRSPTNFQVVLQKNALDKFKKADIGDPAAHFKGKTIHVTGVVTKFENKVEILVMDPDQIKVVEKKE